MKIAYLFSFTGWHQDAPKYILVYAEDEKAAREIGSKQCMFNSGEMAKADDLKLCTFGL